MPCWDGWGKRVAEVAVARGTVRVAAASLDVTVGDWAGNRDLIASALADARARGATIVALPELAVTGYSLGDRVAMKGTLERAWASVLELAPHTVGLFTVLGLPVAHDGAIYDAVAVLIDGQVVAIVPKENLATGDVEYETRWYAGWSRGRQATWRAPDGTELPMGSFVFDLGGAVRVAVEICEDGWKANRPGSAAALAGATVVLNASASWFQVGKHAVRRSLVEAVSREDRVAYVYSSLVGCDATRMVFDGSTLIAVDGVVVGEGERLRMDRRHSVVCVDVDVDALLRARHTEGSWRQQEGERHQGTFGHLPDVLVFDALASSVAPAQAPAAYWLPVAVPADPSLAWVTDEGFFDGPLTPEDLAHIELELALAMGLESYQRKTGSPGYTLALSGGRDSTMCAVLVQRMLRYRHPEASPDALRALVRQHLTTAYLPTENSSEATRHAAQAIAEALGADHLEIGVQETFALHRRLVEDGMGIALKWEDPTHDLALQNLQARIRASVIWTVANLRRQVLLTTSNKSEAAVGYTTMDGDSAGGLAPLADVPKSLISAWLDWVQRRSGLVGLDAVLGTPPTAELRPGAEQTDEGDLMPFAVLDRLTYHFAFLGEEPVVIFQRLWPELAPRYEGDATAFAAHLRRFVTMFCRAQWKRERFAISFRVTAFDLDPKTGFRFPPVQAPFTEELADLDAYVRSLASS